MKTSYCEVCGSVCTNKNNDGQIVKYCCKDCRKYRHRGHLAKGRLIKA